MKILIVAPSRKNGGIERALSVLANEWAMQNYQVIYVSCLKSEPFYHLNTKIKIVEPSFKRSGGFLNKLFFYPKLINYLRKQIKSHQPDRILSFGDFFNPLVLIAANGLGIPTYISDRTSADFNFPFYIKFLKQRMYPKTAGFIAQTQRAYDAKFVQFGENFRQIIIPNAIRDVEKMNIEREKIILFAGRFSWEKNPVALINAFAQIQNKNDWKLIMAGDGPQWSEMKQKTKSLNIENDVVFLGAVPQLDALFNKASIFVLPSVLEGFPNALAEAMTAGLPVVCFDSIAYESIITPGLDGEVVPFNDITALSNRLQKLINDDKIREKLGLEASKKAENWKAETIIKQYTQFLKLS